jgi:uncharacterized protein YggE
MFKNKYFSGLVMTILVLLAAFLGVEINHLLTTVDTANTVSFTGEGKVSAAPDIAVISASIVTQSPNSKTAQDDNSRKSQSVTDFLKKQGIEDKDIQTADYNIYPQYDYSSGSQPRITGYQVTQSYTVKVRDLTKISAVLDGLVTAGANQVNNLGLQIENPDALLSQAREKAIEAAKTKANELKGQVGIRLGRIVNFAENTGNYPVPMYDARAASGAGLGGGGPTISTGQNEVTVSVTLTYQIR